MGPTASARVPITERTGWAADFVSDSQNGDGSFPGFSPIGSTSDAVLSFVGIGRGRQEVDKALDYLETSTAEIDTIGEIGKVTMAEVAGGRDPRVFGERDLVQEILDSEQPDGHYGAHTADDPFDGEVTDHVLAMLALEATPDVDPSSNSLVWLLSAQCEDGGWQHPGPQESNEDEHCFTGDAESDFFRSDTNTTSIAVQAVASHPDAAPYRHNPKRFFKRIRDPKKDGWGYDWTTRLTDANSTALAIQAYVALGSPLPDGAMRALKRLQPRLCGPTAGAFVVGYEVVDGEVRKKKDPDVGATIGAILGLARKTLPIQPRELTQGAARGSCAT
jgi:hypothetical protein